MLILRNLFFLMLLFSLCIIIGCGGGSSVVIDYNATPSPTFPPTSIPNSGDLDLSSYGYCEDTWSDGSYTYVAAKEGGVLIVDTSQPMSPVYKTKYSSPGKAWSLYKEGNYLYVAAKEGGMGILNVINPTQPILVGADNPTGYSAEAVYKYGNYVYWVGGDGASGYFMVTDVTNIAYPSNVAKINLFPSYAGTSIYVDGNYAYVGDARGNFHVVNIASPTTPILVKTLSIGDSTSWGWDVTKSGNYCYMANWGQGLCIIDVTNPSDPKLSSRFTTSDGAYGCKIDGNYAYVAFSWGGLVKVDITNKSSPSQVEVLSKPYNSSMHSVSLNNSYAFMADNGRQHLVVVKYK